MAIGVKKMTSVDFLSYLFPPKAVTAILNELISNSAKMDVGLSSITLTAGGKIISKVVLTYNIFGMTKKPLNQLNTMTQEVLSLLTGVLAPVSMKAIMKACKPTHNKMHNVYGGQMLQVYSSIPKPISLHDSLSVMDTIDTFTLPPAPSDGEIWTSKDHLGNLTHTFKAHGDSKLYEYMPKIKKWVKDSDNVPILDMAGIVGNHGIEDGDIVEVVTGSSSKPVTMQAKVAKVAMAKLGVGMAKKGSDKAVVSSWVDLDAPKMTSAKMVQGTQADATIELGVNIKSAKVLPKVKLKEAKWIGQAVLGTSAGSVYWVVAMGPKIAIAARVDGDSHLHLRAEVRGSSLPACILTLKGIGFSEKGGYYSMHMNLNGVPVVRVMGAMLMELGEDITSHVGTAKEFADAVA